MKHTGLGGGRGRDFPGLSSPTWVTVTSSSPSFLIKIMPRMHTQRSTPEGDAARPAAKTQVRFGSANIQREVSGCRVIPLKHLLSMIYSFIQNYLPALPGTVPVLVLKIE